LAYLHLDKEGRVQAIKGEKEAFGLEDLQTGQLVTGRVNVLEGVLPLNNENLYIPHIAISSVVYADIHIIATASEDWILFLDTTQEAKKLQLIQQQRNEMFLLKDQLNNKFLAESLYNERRKTMEIEQDDNQESLTPNVMAEQINVNVMSDENAKDELKEENVMKKADQGSTFPQAQERPRQPGSDSIDRTLQASILPGSGNIEKIRDILFGSQIREYEKRFVRIEERLNKEINKLRDDLKKRLDALESHLNQEIDLLNDSQKTEKEDRSVALVELSRNFKDTTVNIEKKIGQLEEQLNKRVRELHENALNQSKSLSEDLHKKHEEVSTELEKQSEELQTSKLDRSYMSELLMEIAMRLTDHREMNLKIDTSDLFNE
jgi:hypothetical protein